MWAYLPANNYKLRPTKRSRGEKPRALCPCMTKWVLQRHQWQMYGAMKAAATIENVISFRLRLLPGACKSCSVDDRLS
jgi:hypothetical protein